MLTMPFAFPFVHCSNISMYYPCFCGSAIIVSYCRFYLELPLLPTHTHMQGQASNKSARLGWDQHARKNENLHFLKASWTDGCTPTSWIKPFSLSWETYMVLITSSCRITIRSTHQIMGKNSWSPMASTGGKHPQNLPTWTQLKTCGTSWRNI